MFAIACYFLGQWQWHRYEVKHAAGLRISEHYTATPASLQSVFPSITSRMTLSRDWTRVTVTGTYDAAGQMLVRNRPNSSTYGYEVVVPLRVSGVSGDTSVSGSLLVDRGWVANGATATQDPVVPPVPSGTVTVTGWLRPSEPDVHSRPAVGQLSSINVVQASAFTGQALYPAYAILQTERTAAGTTPVRPTPLDPPDTDTGEGINLSYSIQWWLGCFAGFGLVFMGVRRDHLDEEFARSLPEAPPAEPRGRPASGDGDGSAPDDRASALVPSRPRKHRIWDDEDE